MRTKKLIALLLCLVMVIGSIPLTITAEETATTTTTSSDETADTKVSFDELLTFDSMNAGEQVTTDSLNGMFEQPSLFETKYIKGGNRQTSSSSNLTYNKPTESDSVALRTQAGWGISIIDNTNMLLNNNFVIEYDFNLAAMGSHYTMVRWYTKLSDGTTPAARIMAIDPAGGGSETVDDTTTTYPGSYAQTTSPSIISSLSSSAKTKIIPERWYHYAFYFNIEAGTMSAYRDKELLYTATLTIPENVVTSEIQLHSGGGSSDFYYDNIRIRSIHETDTFINFENSTVGESVTTNILQAELGDDLITIPHVTTQYASINDDSATNQYLTVESSGTAFGSGTTGRNSNFYIEDPYMRLSYTPWVLSFDWRSEGASKVTTSTDSETGEEIQTTTEYDIISDNAGFVTFKSDAITTQSGTLTPLLGFTSGNKIMVGKNTPTTSVTKGTWYRFAIVYNPTTQNASIYMNGEYLGAVSIDMSNATATMFRFGYNWNGLYYKYSIDNISLKTYDDLDIYLDFENGVNGEAVYPADLSEGGAFTYGIINGSSFNKNANTKFEYLKDEDTENISMISKVGDSATYLNIYDLSKKTLSEKFVMSFDLKINATTKTYTLASWRTSSVNIPLLVITNGQHLQTRENLTAGTTLSTITPTALADGTWYNIQIVIDPIGKTALFYLDNELVGTNTFTHDISSATFSALSIGPGSGKTSDEENDYLFYDNIRIYTLKEDITKAHDQIDNLPADGTIFSTDFESLTAGTEMTDDVWFDLSSFDTSSVGGSIAEADGNKYFVSGTSANSSASFKISNTLLTPYEDGVISVETDFAFGSNSANSGNLVIAALKRVNSDGTTVSAPLLTADSTGLLTVAQNATAYTLPAESVHIKLELSYAFHTVNLFINGSAIATGIPLMVNTTMTLAEITVEEKTVSDDMGNVYTLPYTGYFHSYMLDDNGNKLYSAGGNPLYRVSYKKNYGYNEAVAPHIADYIEMFTAGTEAEIWSFSLDNLKIYLDEDVDLLYNGFDSWTTSTAGSNSATVQNSYHRPDSDLNFVDINQNRVASTTSSDTATNKEEGALHIYDKNTYLDGKNFVLEYDLMYNSDYEGTSFDSLSILAFVSTSVSWRHAMRLFPDGTIAYGDAGSYKTYGKLEDDQWAHVQVLLTTNGTGSGHNITIYIDGNKVYDGVSMGVLDYLRIGNQATSVYDLKFDNIRIYLADVPDAYESIMSNTLNGNVLLDLDMSDTQTRDAVMAGEKLGVTWNYKDFDTTAQNINSSTVNVLLDKGDYVRVNHHMLNDSSAYNIFMPKSALGGYKQYVIETEVRYTCPTGFDLEVAKIFNATENTYDKLLYIPGTSREICFNHNGYAYSLTDADGNLLYAEDVTEDATKFTKLALIIDEEEGTYSIYVNGRVAYYSYNGEIKTATEITIDALSAESSSGIPDLLGSALTINNLPTSVSANALLDLKSVKVYVLRTGVAPYVKATQTKDDLTNALFDIRFIAPIDMLYGSEVGFEVTGVTASSNGTNILSSNIVYSSVKATDPETELEREFLANEFDGTYLAVFSVKGVDRTAKDVTITVKPFIKIGDSTIYNDIFTVSYNQGVEVTE